MCAEISLFRSLISIRRTSQSYQHRLDLKGKTLLNGQVALNILMAKTKINDILTTNARTQTFAIAMRSRCK